MTALTLDPSNGGAGSARYRWGPALHNLYLITLLIASLATATSVPVPSPRPRATLLLATGLVVVVTLVVADLAVRRRPAGSGIVIGYLLVAAAVLGGYTTVFPTFGAVAFGLIPLAFALLPRPVALAAGALVTGLPYLIQPYVLAWLSGPAAPVVTSVHFGPVYAIAVGVALPMVTGLLTVAAIRSAQRESRERQRVVDQLSATREELATASRQAGRAEERQRLAHELHDTLAQTLSGVVLQLEAAEQELDGTGVDHDPARLARLLTVARMTARQGLADTRRAVEALRPEALDRTSLCDAITEFCARWSEATGVRVNTAVWGQVRRCPAALEMVALRVVQEALANTAKHAAAGEATVAIGYQPETLLISVRDNGRGFDPASTRAPDGYASGGLGLVTMRERVGTVGGTLAVDSTPGAGAALTATLPDPRRPAAPGAHP
jgi:signal transduction histidine kinase